MKNLFEPASADDVKQRIGRLQSDSTRVWGTMDPAQMLAHMTVNGASVHTGDLYASGTVSGPEPGQRGCLLELTWGGTDALTLPDGTIRAWLDDSDELVITATAPGPDGVRVGLGEARGQIMPAQDPTVG